jgi:predicted nuclease of predicted toxin-antitoxin system
VCGAGLKLLLDENLPHQLRAELPGHDVFTAAFMGWSGIENGELLRLAATAGFDALITNDRGLEYRQNLHQIPIAIVVLLAPANTIEAIRPLCGELLAALQALRPRGFVKLELP